MGKLDAMIKDLENQMEYQRGGTADEGKVTWAQYYSIMWMLELAKAIRADLEALSNQKEVRSAETTDATPATPLQEEGK